MCTLKFKKHCCRGKVIFPSTSWVRALFAEHIWGRAWPVYMREFSTVSPFWFHWFSQADPFFIHWFLPQLESSSSVLCRSLQFIFESFPHQLGISPLALGSVANCACLRLTGCDTTLENCKRPQEYCPVQKPRGLDAFWKARESEPGKAWGPWWYSRCLLGEKLVTKWACLWQCFEHNWKIPCWLVEEWAVFH